MGSGWPERVHPNRSCTECSSSLKVRAHSSGKPMGDTTAGTCAFAGRHATATAHKEHPHRSSGTGTGN